MHWNLGPSCVPRTSMSQSMSLSRGNEQHDFENSSASEISHFFYQCRVINMPSDNSLVLHIRTTKRKGRENNSSHVK